MAKSKAQVEKQKRATEKRKKTEKAILKMAAEMPDVDLADFLTGRRPIPPESDSPMLRRILAATAERAARGGVR